MTSGSFRALLAPILALATVAAAPAGDARAEGGSGILCNQRYALCTSAPCVPDPRDPDKSALGECAVHLGVSFRTWSRTSPRGTAALPVQDTEAFPCD